MSSGSPPRSRLLTPGSWLPVPRSPSFLRSSGGYFGASLLNALLALALVPILTRHLSPYDYGVTATATVIIQIATALISLNAYGLIIRENFTASAAAQSALVSTSVILAALFAGILGVLFAFGGGLMGKMTGFPGGWVWTLAFLAFAQVLQSITLGLFQARSEVFRFGFYQVFNSGLNLGLAILFVVGLGMDWRGRMLAMLATAGICILLFLRELGGRFHLLRPRVNRDALKQLTHFGLPLIPHFLGGWVMTMSPRLFLNHLASVSDTGLYSVAYNLASPLAMMIGAANQAYVPALFKKLAGWEAVERSTLDARRSTTENALHGSPPCPSSAGMPPSDSPLTADISPLDPMPPVERRTSSVGQQQVHFCRLLLLTAFSLPLFAVLLYFGVRWILPWLVGPKFQACAPYVFWLALAFALQGIYFVFGNFVFYSKKNFLLTWRSDFLAGGVTLLLCPLCIHYWGGLGAAVATTAAFGISCVGCITAARKAHPMPWGLALRHLIRMPGRFSSCGPKGLR